jgi:cytochrome c biogenesis protein CcdA
MRPKVKKIISGITSPGGAFIIGFIVTLFLLPCTIGPYVVASGLLSELGLLGALPWLLYYNLIFILPMIAITLIVYFGFARVEDVSGWKEKNIRKLHLIAGILLLLVGLGILMGWI